LLYNEYNECYVGVILVSSKSSPTSAILKNLVYYSSSSSKYVCEPISTALKTLRELRLHKLINFSSEEFSTDILKTWLAELLKKTAEPSKVCCDIVVKLYKELGVASEQTGSSSSWSPEDLFNKNKLSFKSG